MIKTDQKDMCGDFFKLLATLTALLQGKNWRFWYKAFTKVLQKKPPFVADETDVSFSTPPTEIDVRALIEACKKCHGDQVVGPEAIALFLKHATAVNDSGHKFIVGNEADLFGHIHGMTHSECYDKETLHGFGLDFCDPADAFILRNIIVEQGLGESLMIMTPPLESDTGEQFYFQLLRYGTTHPMKGEHRIICSKTEPQFSVSGRVMVFRLRE